MDSTLSAHLDLFSFPLMRQVTKHSKWLVSLFGVWRPLLVCYVHPFGKDSETHRHKHRRCQNYYTRHLRDVGVKTMRPGFTLQSCFSFAELIQWGIYTLSSVTGNGHVKYMASPFLSLPVHIARWAHIHRFPSVCLSVCPSLDNNSYLGKYYSYESETLQQYKALIGACRKNTYIWGYHYL